MHVHIAKAGKYNIIADLGKIGNTYGIVNKRKINIRAEIGKKDLVERIAFDYLRHDAAFGMWRQADAVRKC